MVEGSVLHFDGRLGVGVELVGIGDYGRGEVVNRNVGVGNLGFGLRNDIAQRVDTVAVQGFSNQFLGFFGITDPNLQSFTVFALQVQLFLIPFVGFQIVGSNYFQATGQPAKSVFLSLTRQILFLIPLYIGLPMVMPVWFPGYTGLDALYFACPVEEFLAVFTSGAFVLLELKRLRKLENGQLQAKF